MDTEQTTDDNEPENKQTKKPLYKDTYILWVVVGIYLLYTAYSMVESFQKYVGVKLYLFIAITAFFAIAGFFLLVLSCYKLTKGKWEGGDRDMRK